MIQTVGDLRRRLAAVAGDMPIGIVEKHGRTQPMDDYDDYEGMPTGRLLTVWVTVTRERVELDGM